VSLPKVKTKFQIRREASNSALARLQACTKVDGEALLLKNLQPKLQSNNPRTAWLAREVVCACHQLNTQKTCDGQYLILTRAFRCMNELLQKTWTDADGMVCRDYPLPQEMDWIDLHTLRQHPENTVKGTDCFVEGFRVHERDFFEFTIRHTISDLNFPYVYTDNPYYTELPAGTPVGDPTPMKFEASTPAPLSQEEVLDNLAYCEPYVYEGFRLACAKKLRFRPSALDREVEHRRKFLLGVKGRA
jgi:hypothetical protein